MPEFIEDDFVYVPLEEAITPIAGYIRCFVNLWWSVHPQKGLAFYNPRSSINGERHPGYDNPYGIPMCHDNRQLLHKLVPEHHNIQFIDMVYIPLVINKMIQGR